MEDEFKMTWYKGTYACGHEGEIRIVGRSEEREWKKNRIFSGMCPDCWAKQQNQEAAKKAKELDLPELSGTEKQVAWANTLRNDFIERYEEFLKEIEERRVAPEKEEEKQKNIEEIRMIANFILQTKTKASYYIDHRNDYIRFHLSGEKENALKYFNMVEKVGEKTMEQLKNESTVFPENRITNVVAEISLKDDKILVWFEPNDTFRKIVRSLHFKWNDSEWERKINEFTGSADDRIAELGNKLLNAGIPIRIYNEEVRQKAIQGDYEPECRNWIYRYKGTDKLAISWDGFSDTLYKRAKEISGAYWQSGYMLVSVEHYEEVEKFAEENGFKFSKQAQALISKYKENMSKIKPVNPVSSK